MRILAFLGAVDFDNLRLDLETLRVLLGLRLASEGAFIMVARALDACLALVVFCVEARADLVALEPPVSDAPFFLRATAVVELARDGFAGDLDFPARVGGATRVERLDFFVVARLDVELDEAIVFFLAVIGFLVFGLLVGLAFFTDFATSFLPTDVTGFFDVETACLAGATALTRVVLPLALAFFFPAMAFLV